MLLNEILKWRKSVSKIAANQGHAKAMEKLISLDLEHRLEPSFYQHIQRFVSPQPTRLPMYKEGAPNTHCLYERLDGLYDRGLLYYFQENGEVDYEKARYYFEQAAEQGDAKSQCKLGDVYYGGKGVQRDYIKARHYYELAAEQGDANSQRKLGDIYYHGGNGVRPDYVKAIHYYVLAAEQGNAYSQRKLRKYLS
mmetsp:Transcript_21341/g.38740  ORF Transcript_21341/g.38740 Transcript_21341/m.38740 type:complete len:195 (+) Transcript_21341:2100-2684(+)